MDSAVIEPRLTPRQYVQGMTTMAYVLMEAAWDTIDSVLIMAVQLKHQDLKPYSRALREAYRRWQKWVQYRFEPADVLDFKEQKESVLDMAQKWFAKMTADVVWDFSKMKNADERMLVACANMATIMVTIAVTYARIFERWARVQKEKDLFPLGEKILPDECMSLTRNLSGFRLGVNTPNLPQRARELYNILADEWGFEKVEIN